MDEGDLSLCLERYMWAPRHVRLKMHEWMKVISFFLKGKIMLFIKTCSRSIDPKYNLLKTIHSETISKLIV